MQLSMFGRMGFDASSSGTSGHYGGFDGGGRYGGLYGDGWYDSGGCSGDDRGYGGSVGSRVGSRSPDATTDDGTVDIGVNAFSGESAESAFILFDYQHETDLLKRYIGTDGKLELVVTMKIQLDDEKQKGLGHGLDSGGFLFKDRKESQEAYAMVRVFFYGSEKC